MVPGSLTRHTSTFSLWSNPRPQKLRRTPPPVWVPDRQAGTSILAPSSRCHRGNTNGMLPPKNPFSPQQHWYQPRTIHQSISSPKTLLLSSQGAGSPISDIHSAHMLTSDSFVKYQCICCPGDVPQNIMHHTYKSFTLFVCLLLFFFSSFFCVCCKSFSIKKENKQTKKNIFPIHDFVLLLQQTTFRAPFSKERSRRHWVSVWCKTACFGWNTLPRLRSGTVQPRDWSGDGICFFHFSPLKLSPCAASLGWSFALL